MEKTPIISRSRLSCRRNNNLPAGIWTENEPKENLNTACSTSIFESKMFTDDEESPVHIACTQEGCENVDVVWDWNSPQTKHKPKRSQRRLLLQSPKIPLTRYPSNNHIQNFEKLREELRLLREEISVPDNEECLVLSPVQEAEYKEINNAQDNNPVIQENYLIQDDEQDLFNDSVDEQLVLFSQRIEEDYLHKVGGIKNQLSSNNSGLERNATVPNSNKKPVCDLSSAKDNKLGVHSVKIKGGMEEFANDSFDAVLQELKTESIEELTQVIDRTKVNQGTKNNNHLFPRTKSENQYKTLKPMNTGKVEFHRTQSFESSFEHSKEILPQSKLYEIERKRKEALAKLESKRKQEFGDSPVKCTPVEIEQKRLQALAKLEAKRQQDSIERKRQEALKRLELSRKKNATIVKSSLTKRL